MTLKDLENIIDDESSVGITYIGNKDYPIYYNWKEMKDHLKDEGWITPINKIFSGSFILIELESL